MGNGSSPIGDVLAAYRRALFSGCDSDGRGCRFVAYFAQDPQSTAVARVLAEQAKDIRERYLVLNLAYAVKNQAADSELNKMYFIGYRSLVAELSHSSAPRDRALLAEAARVVSMTVALYGESLGDGAWLDELDPWLASRSKGNLLGPAAFDLFGLASKRGMHRADGKLRPSVARAIDGLANDPSGILVRRREINPLMQAQFEIKDLGAADEYLLIVERAFQRRMAASRRHGRLVCFWPGPAPPIRSAPGLRANRVCIGDARIAPRDGGLFSTTRRGSGQRRVHPARPSQSQELAPMWKQGFLRGAESLRDFAALALADGKALADGDGAARAVDAMFSSLRRSVKVAAVYPQMLAIAYFMGVFDLRFEIAIGWWKITFKTEDVLRQIFDGEEPPWFDYGNDQAAEGALEAYHSYYFLVASGALDDWGIDGPALFEMISRKLLAPAMADIQEQTRLIGVPYQSASWANNRAPARA